jgi:hypothetical protein
MHPLTTQDDVDYRADIADARTVAAQHRNDANRQPVRCRPVIYTTTRGDICPSCECQIDLAGDCAPWCDGVLT